MATQKLTIGILAPSPETRNSVAAQAEATNLAEVKVLANEYCGAEDDYTTRLFLDGRPDFILIDMQNPRAAVKALGVLHTVLPVTWLCAFGGSNDPQLIIETMQAGAREFLTRRLSAATLAAAFARCLDEINRPGGDHKVRGKLYSVTTAKGGSGATSVALNLAVALADVPEKRVAIFDLCGVRGDAAAYLNVNAKSSITDAFAAGARLDPVLLDTFMVKIGSVSLLPGTKQHEMNQTPTPAALAKLLKVASSVYTHTFMDIPANLGQELFEITTAASDAVLVVMTPELPAIWRTRRLIDLLTSAKLGDRIRLILNRAHCRNDIDRGEITRALNHPIYWHLPNDYGAAIQAINQGKAVVEINNTGLAAEYRKLTQDLTGISLHKQRRSLSNLFRSRQPVARSSEPEKVNLVNLNEWKKGTVSG